METCTKSLNLAILAALTGLSLLGETINVMTLGGLALAVGILVDDATVTIENINWHLEQGKEIEPAILDGAQQIVVPATVSLLCICIAFVPMFLLGGVAGYLFRPIAEAVMLALAASYVLSRTLVPTLAGSRLVLVLAAAFAIVSVTVIWLRRTHPDIPRGYRVPGYPVVPVLGIVSCIALIFSVETRVLIFFGWYTLVAVVLYFVYGMHFCANVTCLRDGEAGAVLLRAGEVISDLDVARRRRPAGRRVGYAAGGRPRRRGRSDHGDREPRRPFRPAGRLGAAPRRVHPAGERRLDDRRRDPRRRRTRRTVVVRGPFVGRRRARRGNGRCAAGRAA